MEEEELPTNYEELGITQQIAIKSIEEMLTYLEDKYGETFCFYGYVPVGGVDPEYLEAYSENYLEDIVCNIDNGELKIEKEN